MIQHGTYRHEGGSLVRVMYTMCRADAVAQDGTYERWIGYLLLREGTLWCCSEKYFTEHFAAA